MSHRLLPYRPAVYHGKDSSRPYFEGWYFKQVSNKNTFVVIPGVFRGKHAEHDIAFIQVILGSRTYFFTYPYDAFKYNPRVFEAWIGESYFSMDKVRLYVEEIGLKAEVFFRSQTHLKTSIFSPSIMGPFSYLPAMQCNHGVLSLKHTVNGTLNCGDIRMRFDDAYGYIEKDWGEAFPDSWIWMQCNDKRTSMMCSVATIPYGLFRFTGLICVLHTGGKQYRFATYNGSKATAIKQRKHQLTVEIRRRKLSLMITAHNETFCSLTAPSKTGMNRQIKESVDATYDIILIDKNKTLFDGRLKNGGLELLESGILINNIMEK